MFLAIIVGITLAVSTGCSLNETRNGDRRALLDSAPLLNESLFGRPRAVPDFETLTALTPEQEAHFRRFFNSGVESSFEAHRLLYTYLTREFSDTRFQPRTLPVSTAIKTHSGNCRSLALATTAYARVADIEMSWHLADTDPVYSAEGAVIHGRSLPATDYCVLKRRTD